MSADRESKWVFSATGIAILIAIAAVVFAVVAIIWAVAPAFST